VYVLQYRPGQYPTEMLHELDKKGLMLAKRAYPFHEFEVISGKRAHHWVRHGHPHSTPLYIDANKRIRYARDA
jgi:hypothetical protein